MQWPDHKPRCSWANPRNPDYIRYHDTQWGVPVHDDRMLFEMLVLEAFQAGLSWECVLNKRQAIQEAFAGFDPVKVADFGPLQVQALMADSRLIRNRAKILAAISNARVFLNIQRDCQSFDRYLWAWTNGQTIREQNRTTSPLSDAIARDLKQKGMKFLGSTTVYAYLQAVGVISGHEPGCFLENT